MHPIHRGYPMQAGRGIGSFFGALKRVLTPISRTVLKIGKKAVKSKLGKELIDDAKQAALETGIQMSSNVLKNKDITDGVDDTILHGQSAIAETLNRYGEKKKRQYRKRKNEEEVNYKPKQKKRRVTKKVYSKDRKKQTDLFS